MNWGPTEVKHCIYTLHAILLISKPILCQEGCNNYINVTSNASRSVQANSAETGITLCDKEQTWLLERSWIRFISDNDDLWIPQGYNCPPENACNTNAPGLLYHVHPMVKKTVRRQIYFRFGNNCLSDILEVSVSNCKAFFVYKLLNFTANLSCNYRICAEKVPHPCHSRRHQCDLGRSTCEKTGDTYSCPCKKGFTGNPENCTDVNECKNGANDCDDLEKASCYNTFGSFKCYCKTGFTGDGKSCTVHHPCDSGLHECNLSYSTCKKEPDVGERNYTCPCKVGFTGIPANCTDINECESGAHQCDDPEKASCVNIAGSFTCYCKVGFTGNGKNCSVHHPCDSGLHLCDLYSMCTKEPEVGERNYTCPCKVGFTGIPGNCTDVNECENGTNDCNPKLATCENTVGSYTCHCKPGFIGDGKTCSDVDECTSNEHNCHQQGICTNNFGSFSCQCVKGYTGNGTWCTDVNECDNGTHDCNPALGSCENTIGSFACHCKPGFTGDGKNCSDLNECENSEHNCHQLGICTNNFGSFSCHCMRGYTGNGTWCEDCPKYSVCIQTTPFSCECWRKFFYPRDPEEAVTSKECRVNWPLGMENMMITDEQISASSEYAHYHAAIYGRVNSRNCWIAKRQNRNQWLQIDLVGHNYIVTSVATQGRHCRCKQWVKSFFLQYKGRDDETFQYYKAQGETTRTDFDANRDGNTVIYHKLAPPIIRARFIRFRPTGWKHFIAMRVELYGCRVDIPEVRITNAGPQPDKAMKFSRDETRQFEAWFDPDDQETRKVMFSWSIFNITYPPLNISVYNHSLAPNNLELHIGRRMLTTGLKLVIFELIIEGGELASRDFAFLDVHESALVASITGGSEVARSIKKPVTVDGSQSFDPEYEVEIHAMTFSWFVMETIDNGYMSGRINGSDTNSSFTRQLETLNRTAAMPLNESLHSTSLEAFENSVNNSKLLLPNNASSFSSQIDSLTGISKTLANRSQTFLKALEYFETHIGHMPVVLRTGVFKEHATYGKIILNNKQLIINTTYYIILTVQSDRRIAHTVQTLHLRDEEMVEIGIRCVLNCAPVVSSSSTISLRSLFLSPCDTDGCYTSLIYNWKMLRKGGNSSHFVWTYETDLARYLLTQVDSKNLVLKPQELSPGFEYRLTVDVRSPFGERGWAEYQFKTSEAPVGGSCNATQLESDGLQIALNISCEGWADSDQPLMYEFYRKLDDGTFDMLWYGSLPQCIVHLTPLAPDFKVDLKIDILDALGAVTEEFLQIQVFSPPEPKNDEMIYELFRQMADDMDRFLMLDQSNLVIRRAESLLDSAKIARNRVNESFYEWVIEHVISRVTEVNAESPERLFQVAIMLGKATEDIDKLTAKNMLTVLAKLDDMKKVLVLKAKYKTDTRLIKEGVRSYLYCISNLKKSISESFEGNSTGSFSSSNVQKRTAQEQLQYLTEVMTNTMLSLKQPGEEYSAVKNKLQSTVLGKEEVKDISQLAVKDTEQGAGFQLPKFSSEIMDEIFVETPEVGVQMITYEFIPQLSTNSSNHINSKIVSVDLKNDQGQTLQIKGLPSNIAITVPFSHNANNTNSTAVSQRFLSPGIMNFHIVSVEHDFMELHAAIKLCQQAHFTVYIKYGKKPSENDYDDVVSITDKKNISDSGCGGNEDDFAFREIWFTAIKPGNYYFGLRLDEENTAIQSRNKRSLMSESLSQDTCVTFKNPPPTPPPELVVIEPIYDPQTSLNYIFYVDTIWCAFWSESEEVWSNEGCIVGRNSSSTSLECLCNHLTSFGGEFLVAPNAIDFDAIKQTMENLDPGDLLVLITVCVVFLVYFLVLVAARRADKRDAAKDGPIIPVTHNGDCEYEYIVSITTGAWRNSGTSANVSMVLYGTEDVSDIINLVDGCPEERQFFVQGNTDNFLICLPQSLGSLVKVKIGHDSSGNNASWFLSEIAVLDSQKDEKWVISCYKWLALDKDDGNATEMFYVENLDSDLGFKRKFNILQKTGIADDHLWWSVVCKQPNSSFTRAQRASCCCCFLLLFMVTSAMFYGLENPNQQTIRIGPFSVTPSQLIISVQTALITLLPSVLITILFRKTDDNRAPRGRKDHYRKDKTRKECKLPYFCVYIAWFICVGTAIASALVTVFYSLAWGRKKSARWLSSVVMSLTGDVLISQPIKIIMISFVAASRCGRTKGLQATTHDTDDKPLFEMPSDQIRLAKEFKVKEKKMFKFIKELAFLLLFVLLLMIVCYGDKNDHRFKLTDSTAKSFEKFDQIRNVTHFWRWIKTSFISAIFTGDWYNYQEEEIEEYIDNKRSILVGMPRLRQLRVVKDSCEVPGMFRNIISFCHDFYSHKEEDKDDWRSITGYFNRSFLSCPENWEYSTDDEIGSFDSWGYFATYNGGGYIANLGYNEFTATNVIDDLIANDWIDRQTRAVIVEFSLYNPSSNLLAVLSYYYEVLPSGFAGTFKSYGIIPLKPTHSQAYNVYLFFVLLFGVFLVCCFFKECFALYREKCSYFTSFWNWLELLQILSASCALLLQWEKFKELTKTFTKLKENPFVTINFHQVLMLSEAETAVICITTTFATIRLLKCFYFNAHVIRFSLFLRRHFKSIASFFAIFCVIFTGFALLGVIALGSEYSTFSSFTTAFVTQFLMIIGSTSMIDELEEAGPFIFGRLFSFCFIFTTVIITTNMFVAVLNFSYSNCFSDDLELQEELDMSNFIVNQISKKVFGYTTKEQNGTSKKLFLDLSETKESRETEDLWRSNWSFSTATCTPIMHRSRTVPFHSHGNFDDGEIIVHQDINNAQSLLWETCKADEKPRYYAPQIVYTDIEEELITGQNKTSRTLNSRKISLPAGDVCLAPLNGHDGDRLKTGCVFLVEDIICDADGYDDDYDDIDVESDKNYPWEEFLKLLDDDCFDDPSSVDPFPGGGEEGIRL